MKHSLIALTVSTILTFALPSAVLATVPDDSPGASQSPEISASPKLSPEASETPKSSVSPTASKTPEVEDTDTPEPSKTPKISGTPRVFGTPRASKTPEVEDQSNEQPEHDAVQTPEVNVPKDLEDDVAKLASGDQDLKRVEVNKDEGRVEVKYRLRARLFGLIDVPYELDARVDAKEGTIKASGPWWLLFARDNVGDVQTALKADTTLTTDTNQGAVLSRIISILKSLAR